MASNFMDSYHFFVDWYDKAASLTRKYKLCYYPSDSNVEMYNVPSKSLPSQSHSVFLKKTKCEGLRLSDLHIGAVVTIFGRQLVVKEYGDLATEKRLKSQDVRTLAIVKPDAIGEIGSIINTIYEGGFVICNAKMVKLSRNDAEQFYKEHYGKPFFERLIAFMTSGNCLAMELRGNDAVTRWRSIIGPTDSRTAQREAPSSLRAQFGTDNTANACHGSDSDQSASREIEFFFQSNKMKNTERLFNTTLCVIKPHAVAAGDAGKILMAIKGNGFNITALQMFNLQMEDAEEFLEVYKVVLAEYSQMVQELCGGPCIAVELFAGSEDAQSKFRAFAGPGDPVVAKALRPATLRALFGCDSVKNAVHCTDLPEDASLEVEYFFRVLDGSN